MNVDIFNFVKNNIDLKEVCASYGMIVKDEISVTEGQLYLKYDCPFGKCEKSQSSPAFSVVPKRRLYYCATCFASGDPIGFVARMENKTPIDALKKLLTFYRISVPDDLVESASSTLGSDFVTLNRGEKIVLEGY